MPSSLPFVVAFRDSHFEPEAPKIAKQLSVGSRGKLQPNICLKCNDFYRW